jgi:hypothetical protein
MESHCGATRRSAKAEQRQACEPIDMVEGATVGCLPDLYSALSGNPPDQVISLWSDFCAHWVHLSI